MTIIIIICAAVILYFALRPVIKNETRKRLRQTPFPEEWKPILNKRFPLYQKLPPNLQDQLESDIQIFIAEKKFFGCGGLEITDEIRVTVAAQACMLILNRKKRYFPRLVSIYMYPSTYVAKRKRHVGGGLVSEEVDVNLGESWTDGRLVLAWDASKHGAVNMYDGHNVVFHEFAHQLDQEDGAGDGVPKLSEYSKYSTWISVLGKEFELLKRGKKHRSVIDKYGATNGAEYFASATEAFFEKPDQLKRKHAELYEELKDYFCVDPAEWI